ncbi:MAG: glutamate mutase L [bacterium]|nr:glutamate mutase L [bacterium]
MRTDPLGLKTVLVTDCGSTTTKAVMFEKKLDGWHQTFRGEAPTTVEEPVADVTVGAKNAFIEVEELSKRKFLRYSGHSVEDVPFIITDKNQAEGIDLYLSTSSAGGGLQMIVGGVVKEMSAESAERAALGAGAIVLDVLSADDGRAEHEKIDRIRHLKPDIVLLTGGIDGGTKSHVVEVAELLLAASPKPRFGDTLKLPVIYAGNKDAREEVEEILKSISNFEAVDNIRPTLEEENLKPARDLIHEFFLKHVMSHAPGYGKLLRWTPVAVMPTPGAVGNMISDFASRRNLQVLAADIGGATTDVFSVFNNKATNKPIFNRTVSANLGMSYSIANVLIEAGTDNIKRWLPYEISDNEIHDRLRNKMIRPTSIPQTIDDLNLEQAVCREALRLSFLHHRSLAVGLSGTKQKKGISDIFSQATGREELVDLLALDLVIGSGGVLSHAPDRKQAALMMLDAYELQGVTQIAVDSIFMLPHLGVFSSVHPEAASEILLRDCLINLAHVAAPIFPSKIKISNLASVFIDGNEVAQIKRSEVVIVPNSANKKATLKVVPLNKSINVGNGPGEILEREIELGEIGLILDGRNRPIEMPEETKRVNYQKKIYDSLGLRY